ncbi:hypothetical protein D3273_15030 [Lichenibacterium minor]|uniref:Uncharacterized protein n=1 Tax=Lichenibacterium minor TaxID=2316528 RepID=A0A4Q2U3V8_9HYPH|nr:hypothetical protein [Lichenibacterium minor]RYC31203.1 hypothetical protein D3273_15030 [Lichenibacterium minor]
MAVAPHDGGTAAAPVRAQENDAKRVCMDRADIIEGPADGRILFSPIAPALADFSRGRAAAGEGRRSATALPASGCGAAFSPKRGVPARADGFVVRRHADQTFIAAAQRDTGQGATIAPAVP